jgi:3-oxoacyl-[acyl-carrier protein] reductase
MKFKDKIVLITGSSRNLGFDMAREFLKQGARVAINSRAIEDAERAIAAMADIPTGEVLAVPADISDPQAIAEMFDKIEQHWGSVEILVNNACNLGLGGSFLDLSLDCWDSTVAVNLRGTFLCSQTAARAMAKQGTGCIINISSISAQQALRNRAAYNATKGGIDGEFKGHPHI